MIFTIFHLMAGIMLENENDIILFENSYELEHFMIFNA